MEVLLLRTRDDPLELANQGFSGSWSLNARRAIGCDYAIICDLSDGSGMLVGKVKGLMRTHNPSRFDVHFSATATINEPNVWTRTSQNPVGYANVKDLPIDFQNLKFEPVVEK